MGWIKYDSPMWPHMSRLYMLSSIVVVTSMLIPCVDGATKEDVYNVHNYIFNNSSRQLYNKRILPLENNTDGGSVTVYLSFSLLSVEDIVERQQTLVTAAELLLYWEDVWLSWEPEYFGDLWSLLVWQDDVWLPDIIVSNSATSSDNHLGFKSLPVRILCYGYVMWQPSAMISTACNVDVTFFPFDIQVCNIDFATEMSFRDEVIIKYNKTAPVRLHGYKENGQWELLDAAAKDLEDVDDKTKIRFSFLLKRRRAYYIINILIPVMFLSFTATLVFALPASAGEKMSMGITVLLAYSVYLSIVSGHLPRTSIQISVLALYLTILLAMTATSVIASVFILRLHHKHDSELAGSKVARFTLILRAVTCTSKKKETPGQQKASLLNENHVRDTDEPATSTLTMTSASATDPETLTWPAVAETLDWFLFLVFTILNVLSTVIFLTTLVVGASVYSPSLHD